jgi:hypothetical protein
MRGSKGSLEEEGGDKTCKTNYQTYKKIIRSLADEF